jgi:hypothetical protein
MRRQPSSEEWMADLERDTYLHHAPPAGRNLHMCVQRKITPELYMLWSIIFASVNR